MHGAPSSPYDPYNPPPMPGPPMPGKRPPNAGQGNPLRWWIVAGAALVLVVLGGLAAAVTPDDGGDGQPTAAAAPAVPAYKVVEARKKGMAGYVTVEVKAMPPDGGLRAVFDDVRKRYPKDGGYFVTINCATGGTAKVDNRLANGRYAVGREGEAATGLDDGKAEFEVLPDAACPA